MGIIIKQAGLSSLFSYLGIGLGFLNVAILMNHWLTPDELGLRITLIDVSIIFTQFAQVGSAKSLVRFFPYFKRKTHNDRGLLSVGILSCLIGFVITGLLVFVFKGQILSAYEENSKILTNYFWLVFPISFLLLYNELFDAYLQARSETVFTSFIKNVLLRVLTTISIVLFYFEFLDFEMFLLSILVFYFINIVLLVGYLKIKGEISLKIDYKLFSRRFRKIYFNYGAFVILSSISSLMANKIDSLMLGSMLGFASVAIYTNAVFFTTLIYIPSGTIAKISLPILSEYWRLKQIDKIKELYQKTAISQFLLGGSIFILLWCGIDSVFLLQKPEYSEGKYVLLLLGSSRALSLISGVNAQILSVSKYFRYDTISILALGVFTVITNLLFIPRWGLIGASAATSVSIILFDFIRIIIVYRKIGIHPFTRETLKLVGIFTFVGVILISVPNLENIILNSIFKGSISMLVILFGTVYFNISEDFNRLFYKYIKKLNL